MAETHFNISILQGDFDSFNLSPYIDKDSISFSYSLRRSQVTQTLDGYDHVAGSGKRLTFRFGFNPLPSGTALSIMDKLLETPTLTISFTQQTLQAPPLLPPDTGQLTMVNMRLNGGVSGSYLSKCEYREQDWYQIDPIELVEL